MTYLAAAYLASGLSPSNDEARDWARDELAKIPPPDSSSHFLNFDGTGRIVPTIIAIVLAVALLALIVYALRFVRRTPRPRKPDGADNNSLLGDNSLPAKSLRATAEERFAAGDYDACVRAAMRTLARRSAERALLTDAPSLTAREVAVALRAPFATHTPRLDAAAAMFDAVAYGDHHATPQQAKELLDLDDALAAARPNTDTASVGVGDTFAVPR